MKLSIDGIEYPVEGQTQPHVKHGVLRHDAYPLCTDIRKLVKGHFINIGQIEVPKHYPEWIMRGAKCGLKQILDFRYYEKDGHDFVDLSLFDLEAKTNITLDLGKTKTEAVL